MWSARIERCEAGSLQVGHWSILIASTLAPQPGQRPTASEAGQECPAAHWLYVQGMTWGASPKSTLACWAAGGARDPEEGGASGSGEAGEGTIKTYYSSIWGGCQVLGAKFLASFATRSFEGR